MEAETQNIPITDLLRGCAENLNLRIWTPDDADAASDVVRALGTEVLGEKLHTWEAVFDSPNGILWTAELSGYPVGFASVGFGPEGAVLFHTDIVHPEAQGCGVGTALTLVRLATLDPDEVNLIGLEATQRSLGFYRRFGFTEEADQHFEETSKVWLQWLHLEFDDLIGNAAAIAIKSAGVSSPLDTPNLDF